MACNCSFSSDNPVMLRELDIRRVINRNAMKCFTSSTDCFWSKSSDGTVYVPYTISSVFDNVQRSTILDAMKTFASETCVQFIPQTNEVDYVSIESDVGCYAYIGKIGGAQTVSLDVNGCVYNGVIQHELNHALGFVHEHTRSDRDLYVEIIWKYISENDVQNFEKQDTNNLGTPYDYSSVMHYSNYAFSNVTGMETIVPIPDRTVPIGQRQELSPIDIERINLLYNCYNITSTSTQVSLTGAFGTFSSPNFPLPYPNNVNYFYLIQIPTGQVQLQFNSFNILVTQGCSGDYIMVYDGSSKSAPVLLNKTCGSTPIPTLTGSSTSMLVQFVTDASATAPGFTASYSTCPIQIVLTGSSGTFNSPNYPSPYPKNVNYQYLIQIPSGEVYVDFNTINIQTTPGCSGAYIKAYDGPTKSSPVLLDKTCGNLSILSLLGSSNLLLIEFVTDASVPTQGFSASYSSYGSGPTQLLMTGALGSLNSPNYPENYPVNTNSLILIQIPSGQIRLQFNSFNIQSTPECSGDYIKVYDGSTKSSPVLLDKTCGARTIPTVTSSGSSMLVEFVTDATGTTPGFTASYTTISSGPTQVQLMSASGTFTSPKYPSPYPINTNYVYLIKIPIGQVLLQFNIFHIQSNPGCANDYIKIYDGSSKSSPVLLDKQCGRIQVAPIVSSANTMMVEFVTDASGSAPGFLASFSTGLLEKITITSAMTDFYSKACIQFIPWTNQKDYVSIEPQNGCWSSVGKVGGKQVVSLQRDTCLFKGVIQHELNHVLGFLHEQSRSDRDQYVRINWEYISPEYVSNFGKINTNNLGTPYDYSSVMHYSRDAFSNTTNEYTITPIPNPNVTIGQRIGLSSMDIQRINLLYKCNSCSTSMIEKSGNFSSANYPSQYPANSRCYFTIQLPADRVLLQFNSFSVQRSPGCTTDYVRLFDGSSRRSPVIMNNTCGSGPVIPIISSTSAMLVEFVTSAKGKGTGFTASYASVQCGGNMNSMSGTFATPNYPDVYPVNVICDWIIVVPAKKKIQLQISPFNVEFAPGCIYDYLVVFDGPSLNSPILNNKYCGIYSSLTLTSSRNVVVVQFYSDSSDVFPGFNATYTAI
ncbi:UVS2 protein, partial [Polypterus senegalus]